jgi:hypothetical protein
MVMCRATIYANNAFQIVRLVHLKVKYAHNAIKATICIVAYAKILALMGLICQALVAWLATEISVFNVMHLII